MVLPKPMEVYLDDSQQFTRSAGMVSEHVVPLEGDCTMPGGPVAARSMGAERPVFVVSRSQWAVAQLRDGSHTTSSQRRNAKLRESAESAVQLSLFPEPTQPEYECAPLGSEGTSLTARQSGQRT